jgi:hypothetical protein
MQGKDTYSLAKGLHHINIAKQYFEDVKLGCRGELKAMFNAYINKCDWILNNIYDKLSSKTREVYREEMSDSLGIDHVIDQFMRLDNSQRVQVEDIIDSIIKGKNVTVKVD